MNGGDIRAQALGPAGDDAMAMYVQLLSAVLGSEEADAHEPGVLLSVARASRLQMLTSSDRLHRSAEGDLAYDVQYDCALIKRVGGQAGADHTTPRASQTRARVR